MTTNTELLKKVIDSLINEDDAGASESFKLYATHKFKTILEGDKADEKDEDDKKDDDCEDKDDEKEDDGDQEDKEDKKDKDDEKDDKKED